MMIILSCLPTLTQSCVSCNFTKPQTSVTLFRPCFLNEAKKVKERLRVVGFCEVGGKVVKSVNTDLTRSVSRYHVDVVCFRSCFSSQQSYSQLRIYQLG